MDPRRSASVVLAACVCLAAVGCRVHTHTKGGDEDVKIATPFGGLSVQTNDAAVMDGIGLPAYPGAQLVKKKGKEDDDAADVNLSFGSFQLRVKAASYRTPDAPEKVQAFYRKALGRYGVVLDCVNDKAEGTLTHTAEGLTCDEEKHTHLGHSSGSSDAFAKHELKAGSKQHQHIATVESEGTGAKIGLVALDLPGHISFDSGDGNSEKTQ